MTVLKASQSWLLLALAPSRHFSSSSMAPKGAPLLLCVMQLKCYARMSFYDASHPASFLKVFLILFAVTVISMGFAFGCTGTK